MKISKTNGKIDIVGFDPWSVFEISCKIEQQGIEFYGHLAEKMTDKKTKDIMEELKKAEVIHLEKFRKFQDEIPKPSHVDEEDIYQMMNFGIFQGRYDWKLFKEIKDAVEFGIYIEEKSIEFYSFYQKIIKDDRITTSLEKIINEEKKHKLRLELILQTMFPSGEQK